MKEMIITMVEFLMSLTMQFVSLPLPSVLKYLLSSSLTTMMMKRMWLISLLLQLIFYNTTEYILFSLPFILFCIRWYISLAGLKVYRPRYTKTPLSLAATRRWWRFFIQWRWRYACNSIIGRKWSANDGSTSQRSSSAGWSWWFTQASWWLQILLFLFLLLLQSLRLELSSIFGAGQDLWKFRNIYFVGLMIFVEFIYLMFIFDMMWNNEKTRKKTKLSKQLCAFLVRIIIFGDEIEKCGGPWLFQRNRGHKRRRSVQSTTTIY